MKFMFVYLLNVVLYALYMHVLIRTIHNADDCCWVNVEPKLLVAIGFWGH